MPSASLVILPVLPLNLSLRVMLFPLFFHCRTGSAVAFFLSSFVCPQTRARLLSFHGFLNSDSSLALYSWQLLCMGSWLPLRPASKRVSVAMRYYRRYTHNITSLDHAPSVFPMSFEARSSTPGLDFTPENEFGTANAKRRGISFDILVWWREGTTCIVQRVIKQFCCDKKIS